MLGSFGLEDFLLPSLFFFLLKETGSFSRFIDLGCFFLSLWLPWLLVSLSCPGSCWFLVHSFPSLFMTNDKIYKRRKRKRVTSTTTRNKLHTWMVFCQDLLLSSHSYFSLWYCFCMERSIPFYQILGDEAKPSRDSQLIPVELGCLFSWSEREKEREIHCLQGQGHILHLCTPLIALLFWTYFGQLFVTVDNSINCLYFFPFRSFSSFSTLGFSSFLSLFVWKRAVREQ